MTHFRQSTGSQLPAYQYAYGDKTASGVCMQSASDYSPFGVLLDGRSMQKTRYRYGHDGQELVNEVSGIGNHYTATFWEYDPRLGRRWNVDPVVKEHEAPYACFANNPIFYVDPNGADKIKFDEDGNYVSGEKKGKVHEFFFGSKGSVVDKEGNTIREFKFNDKKVGQVENFEGEEPLYSGIDLTFEGKIEDITDLATKDAPDGSIWNKEKREWIKNASSDIVNGGTGNSPLDFLGTNVDWGGDGFTDDGRIRIVGDKAYDDFDAGNLLWGRAMQKLDIGIVVSRMGAHANAFMYGKLQYAQTNRKGEDIEFTEEDRKKFSLRQITWTGDSRLDQKAIRHGHRIGRRLK